MNLMERREIYKRAVKKFGFKAQFLAAIEELAELQVEIAKELNGKRPDITNLIDEVADVKIMIEQIEYMLNIDVSVNARILKKIDKLKGYL